MNLEETIITKIEETPRSLRCKEIRKMIQGLWRLWLRHPEMRFAELIDHYVFELMDGSILPPDKQVNDRIMAALEAANKAENKE